ncbi:MAG: hypothetical protein ACON4H_05595 [Rubripirellula sp.]
MKNTRTSRGTITGVKLLWLASLGTIVTMTFNVNSIASGNDRTRRPATTLKITDETPMTQIRSSMIGYRDTVIFYSLRDNRAVVKVNIDNKGTNFPINATVFLFEAKATQEEIDKWINNQHSDALYADALEPISRYTLPKNKAKILSYSAAQTVTDSLGQHVDYTVHFKIRATSQKGSFQLKTFKDEASVFVKKK